MRHILAVIAAFFIAGIGGFAYAGPECHQGMQVTGYYIPSLIDYDTRNTQQVLVDGAMRTFNASFLVHAQLKEKGIVLSGEVIVLENGEWSIDDYPLSDAERRWFPSEKDYRTTRMVKTFEDGRTREYPKAFVDASGEQGWGRVAKGEYIGKPLYCFSTDGLDSYKSPQCNDKWHYNTRPLDANGKPLELGVVATNKEYFNSKSPWKVTIDPKPVGFPNQTFEVRDTGVESGINIFCGSGLEGLKCAMKVTNNASTVCFTKTSQD